MKTTTMKQEESALNRQIVELARKHNSLWIKACFHDKINPKAMFVVFSADNPHSAKADEVYAELCDACDKRSQLRNQGDES